MANKNIYAALGVNPRRSEIYIKFGDTCHIDPSLRDTYLQHEAIKFPGTGLATFPAKMSNGDDFRDYYVHEIIEKNFQAKLRRDEKHLAGREQFTITCPTINNAYKLMEQKRIYEKLPEKQDLIYQQFIDDYIVPLCEQIRKTTLGIEGSQNQFVPWNSKETDTIVSNIVAFCLISNEQERSLLDIFENVQTDKDKMYFECHVGCSFDQFRDDFNKGRFSKQQIKKINDDISELSKIENVVRNEKSISKAINIVLDQLIPLIACAPGSDTIGASASTPRLMIEQQFNQIPEDFWSDPNQKLIDPTCGRGTYLLAAIKYFYIGLRKIIPNGRIRLAHIISNMIYGNDKNHGQIDRCVALLKLVIGYRGTVNVSNHDSLIYNFNDMKFDVVIGNPPYNGIARNVTPKSLQKYLVSGFESYYPFIARGKELLKENGHLCLITPHKWLMKGGTTTDATSLRNELFKGGKFANLKICNSPPEWKKANIKTHQVVIFDYELNREKHIDEIHQFSDGTICNVRNEIEWKIWEKISSLSEKYECVKFFQCPFTFDETGVQPEYDCLLQHSTHVKKHVKLSEILKQRIENDLSNGKIWIAYPDGTNVPFKKNLRAKNPIEEVTPRPIAGAYVVVSTSEPRKMRVLLESNLAKLVWRMFYTSTHFCNSLTNRLPDITPLLPSNPIEQDINNIFGLLNEEIQYLNELSKTYGDM